MFCFTHINILVDYIFIHYTVIMYVLNIISYHLICFIYQYFIILDLIILYVLIYCLCSFSIGFYVQWFHSVVSAHLHAQATEHPGLAEALRAESVCHQATFCLWLVFWRKDSHADCMQNSLDLRLHLVDHVGNLSPPVRNCHPFVGQFLWALKDCQGISSSSDSEGSFVFMMSWTSDLWDIRSRPTKSGPNCTSAPARWMKVLPLSCWTSWNVWIWRNFQHGFMWLHGLSNALRCGLFFVLLRMLI